MQRNYHFKPGRGSRMLQQLDNKENMMNDIMDNVLCTEFEDYEEQPMQNEKSANDSSIFNNSSDIIEGTPSPSILRNSTLQQPESQSNNHNQHTICEPFNVVANINQDNTELVSLEDLCALDNMTTEESILTPAEENAVLDDLNLSDDSVADPDWINLAAATTRNEEVDNDSDEPEIKVPKKIKTTRWHKRNEDKYDRNLQKKNKSQCLPYKNYKKRLQPAKAPKPCHCKCKLNCTLNVSEEERIEICKSYWALEDYTRQKDFILKNVTVNAVKRRLVNASRQRTVTRCYFFQINERKIRVCELFFKTTLCISNGPINKAFSDVGTSGSFSGEDKRGKHEAHNKTKQEDVDIVKDHIDSFPKMESHYCRKTSSKNYLDCKLSISKMYELYVEKCKTADKVPVSINVYRNIFCTQYNLDFHKPKKDQCLLCHKYKCAKAQNSSDLSTWQQKYDEHMSLKEQSREAKELDKARANEDETFCSVTLDLQKVLHLPSSNVSLLYYLRKLNVYNATIYEARSPNDGFCYLWTEIDGKKGSDEIGTALYLWIKRLPPTVTEISIFSDTCGGQNRNQFLLCLQLYLVQTTHLEVIEHKYLESGHTHMEVDSMHSAIENQMRLMPIMSIIDLCNVIRLARSNKKTKKGSVSKKPYEPIIMNNTDILDLRDLRNNLMFNRSVSSDGEKVQWLKVKHFRFEKKKPSIVLFRYDYKSEYKELNVAKQDRAKTASQSQPQQIILRNRKANIIEPVKEFDYNSYVLKKAYNKKLPITKAKKNDLLKMCSEKIIPPELHHWYQSLPDKEGRDFLPDEDLSDLDEDQLN